jgi:hypothetical protein
MLAKGSWDLTWRLTLSWPAGHIFPTGHEKVKGLKESLNKFSDYSAPLTHAEEKTRPLRNEM